MGCLLSGCAGRSFDNPVDPGNQQQNLRLVTFYSALASQPAGIEFDKGLLWVVDSSDGSLFRINASDGRFDFRQSLDELGSFFGVTSDGVFLWLTRPGGSLVRINPFNGELVQPPLPTPGSDPRGVAFDGGQLWVLDGAELSLATVDPMSGESSVSARVSGLTSPGGMTFRGSELWAIDQFDSRLVRLGLDGVELASFTLPTRSNAVGLSSDGERFYYSDRAGNINVVEFVEGVEP